MKWRMALFLAEKTLRIPKMPSIMPLKLEATTSFSGANLAL